jgi:hypothetical protein
VSDVPHDVVPDDLLDQLCAARPDEFVAARDRLAKELRTDGSSRPPRCARTVVESCGLEREPGGESRPSCSRRSSQQPTRFAPISAGDGGALRVAMRATDSGR